jgi:hypothetical protein
MRLWYIFQNDKSYEIVTHHLRTNFWKKKKIEISSIPLLVIGLPCNLGNPIEMGLRGPHAEAARVRCLHAEAGGSCSPS